MKFVTKFQRQIFNFKIKCLTVGLRSKNSGFFPYRYITSTAELKLLPGINNMILIPGVLIYDNDILYNNLNEYDTSNESRRHKLIINSGSRKQLN